jgi:hypothetical protein
MKAILTIACLSKSEGTGAILPHGEKTGRGMIEVSLPEEYCQKRTFLLFFFLILL